MYYVAIGSSTDTSNVVINGGSYDNIVVHALVYKNINQTNPINTQAKNTGSGTNLSVTIDPNNQSMIVTCYTHQTDASSFTFNDGQNARHQNTGTTLRHGSGDILSVSGASTTYDVSSGATGVFGAQAIALSSVGVSSSIQVNGRLTSFTGLTPNSKYYLSNTAGEIGTSAGSTSVLLGKALSATELLIIQN
jgi:hypothetical protein